MGNLVTKVIGYQWPLHLPPEVYLDLPPPPSPQSVRTYINNRRFAFYEKLPNLESEHRLNKVYV